jgi:CheY-like chemotaxis protein
VARILVIDDNALVRSVVREKLRRAGHTVFEAGNGREGMAAFHDSPADLVLTDLTMPDVDGMETVASFHEHYPQIPIVAMSGSGGSAMTSLNTAILLGASSALPKPFTPSQLLEAVNDALNR